MNKWILAAMLLLTGCTGIEKVEALIKDIRSSTQESHTREKAEEALAALKGVSDEFSELESENQEMRENQVVTFLLWSAGGLLLSALLLGYFGQVRTAIACALCSGGLLATVNFYDEIMWAIGLSLLGVAGYMVYFVIQFFRDKRAFLETCDTLQAIKPKLSEDAYEEVFGPKGIATHVQSRTTRKRVKQAKENLL